MRGTLSGVARSIVDDGRNCSARVPGGKSVGVDGLEYVFSMYSAIVRESAIATPVLGSTNPGHVYRSFPALVPVGAMPAFLNSLSISR